MQIDEFIKSTMGSINFDCPFGLVLWANRPPGEGFILHVTLSGICTNKKPVVLIDDILPQALLNKSSKEQQDVNTKYSTLLSSMDCCVIFVSEIYETGDYFYRVAKILESITYPEMIRCLPQKKKSKEVFDSLRVSEVLHVAAELMLFDEIRNFGIKTILVPEFAQAIIALHRNIRFHPLNAIITTKFSADTNFDTKNLAMVSMSDDIKNFLKTSS